MAKIKVGDAVVSAKGSRFSTKKPKGVVTALTKWRHYPAAVVKKAGGGIRTFLVKNLSKVGK